MESTKKSNKISGVDRLRRLLKKWRNFANSSRTVTSAPTMSLNRSCIHRSISFLKRTISSLSSDGDDGTNNKKHSSGNSNVVPKGHLAVCVSKELERFVIPTYYLGHPAFGFLLREAKEVFGFSRWVSCESHVTFRCSKVFWRWWRGRRRRSRMAWSPLCR